MAPQGLSIQSATKTFAHPAGDVCAVDNISLDILPNEFFTLLGPSGCGKTTLLRMIAGFETIDSGSIWLDGQNIAALEPYTRPVNTVFQNYALFPHMTVAQNIGFGLEMQGKDKKFIARAVEDALQMIRLGGMGARKPAELSGGQQQRVALARALVNHPKVLLLDESLSALDYKLRKEMQTELKNLQRDTGITFIFVTHDQDEALSMSDRIAVMNGGKLSQLGAPHEIYDRPANRFVANFIGICNFVSPGVFGLNETSDVGFRPEDASFAQSSAEPVLRAHGRIANINYRGAVTHYHITLANGQNITLSEDIPQDVRVGDGVSFCVAPERLIRCA